LRQQKAYQRVVAPFDGVITQRNIDVGSLVQADAMSGTFMFKSNVIRAQVFVPQDLAFGVSPGIDAILHIPEIPDRAFPGNVTRIANALAPGTHIADRSRYSQSRRIGHSRVPLHHRAAHPAQDSGGCWCRVRPSF
jgi:multidrug resistance efflux pump